ncbi:TIGR03752 family integrating conjugative element protein, partial [Pseudomonas syringae pv. tagetis]
MKGNPLLKYLLIPFILFVIFFVIKSLGSAPTPNTDTPDQKLTSEQAKALGVEGDTPSDTIRT